MKKNSTEEIQNATSYLLRLAANARRLRESMAQAASGNVITHELIHPADEKDS